MASLFKRRGTYVVAYRLKGQKRQRIYGIKTLAIARQVKHAKELEEQLAKTGLHRPVPNAAKFEAAEEKAITKHIDDFERSIRNRDKHPQHAQQTASHVRRLFKLAGITRLSEMEGEAIQAAAKRLIDEQGLAPRTANAAIKAARQFSTWCSGPAKLTASDLLHRKLTTYNEATDVRRLRRALEIEELARLLSAAREGRRRSNLSGADRAMLYQVAIGTGFRMRACISLTKASFHVDPRLATPFIRLAARFNKNRKERDQEIRKDLAAALHAWLAGKPDGQVWKPSKHAHLELLMRRDLEKARAAWLAEAGEDRKELERREASSFLLYKDHAGRFADFHSLRHTGISLVVRRAGLKVGQAWADHSTPLLTAKYAHLDLSDRAAALDALPPVEAPQAPSLAENSGKGRSKTDSRKIG
jgi:hypothetical protein